MASRFAIMTEEKILAVNEATVPDSTKMATEFGLTVFKGAVSLFLATKLSPKPTQNKFPELLHILRANLRNKRLLQSSQSMVADILFY